MKIPFHTAEEISIHSLAVETDDDSRWQKEGKHQILIFCTGKLSARDRHICNKIIFTPQTQEESREVCGNVKISIHVFINFQIKKFQFYLRKSQVNGNCLGDVKKSSIGGNSECKAVKRLQNMSALMLFKKFQS